LAKLWIFIFDQNWFCVGKKSDFWQKLGFSRDDSLTKPGQPVL